jgi:hypothetical protein
MTPSGTFKQPKKPDPVVLWWKGLPRETRAAVVTTGGCLAAIAAIVWFAILPALSAHADLASKSSELGARLEAIHRDAQRTQKLEEEADALAAEVSNRCERLVLEPLVNSLSEAGAARLRPLAAEHGVVFTVPAMEHEKLPIADPGAPPPSPPGGARYFARQPVVFRATAGWWGLLDFLSAVAEEQPAATLVALSVAPRSDSPDSHDVSFTLEWPVESERPAAKGGKKGGAK